jgi:hypothetical protein
MHRFYPQNGICMQFFFLDHFSPSFLGPKMVFLNTDFCSRVKTMYEQLIYCVLKLLSILNEWLITWFHRFPTFQFRFFPTQSFLFVVNTCFCQTIFCRIANSKFVKPLVNSSRHTHIYVYGNRHSKNALNG